MDEIKQVLQQYSIDSSELSDYKTHPHDPDMWSHTFEIKNKKYILVEVEAVDDALQGEEYERLEDDLHIKRTDLKLVMPKLEQMHTVHNRDGIGIDGHRVIINADDTAKQEPKRYKNPHGLQSETTWVLFELL